MEVKKGYKKTDVGIIPEDWEVKKINDVLKLKYGQSQSNISNENGSYPVVGTSGIVGKSNFFIYDKPSILIGRKGTIDSPQYFDEPFWAIDTIFYSEISKDVNPKFLFFKLSQIKWLSYNEASGVPSLNAQTIGKIKIPLPPTKQEQAAIARVLSDTDELISSLEKLIEKKKLIKQGVMQQLLTGKKRLPGFSGKWEVKKLGEIAEIIKGEQLNREYLSDNDAYPVMNGGVIASGYSNKFNTKANTIIISEGGNSCGYVNFIKVDFWKGGHCYEIKSNIHKIFLYHLLKYNEPLIMSLRVGSGLPNIQKNRLFNFELIIPPYEEQIVIANFIDDLESEIESLAQKLNKYKSIKQGMMEKLLTGKIRLV